MTPVQLFVASFLGWLQHEQKEIILYLREENRVVEAQLRHQRLRLTDHDRRRLAALGERLGRRMLAQVAMIVTPDTMAPAAHRPEMDVLETASRTAQCASGDPPPRRADGD